MASDPAPTKKKPASPASSPRLPRSRSSMQAAKSIELKIAGLDVGAGLDKFHDKMDSALHRIGSKIGITKFLRESADEKQARLLNQLTDMEYCCHFVLVIICVVFLFYVVGPHSSDGFFLNHYVEAEYVDAPFPDETGVATMKFTEIGSVDDLDAWFGQILKPNLFPDPGDAEFELTPPMKRQAAVMPMLHSPDGLKRIDIVSFRVLFAEPRMEKNSMMRQDVYAEGLPAGADPVPPGWVWRSADANRLLSDSRGRIGNTYPGGGFVLSVRPPTLAQLNGTVPYNASVPAAVFKSVRSMFSRVSARALFVDVAIVWDDDILTREDMTALTPQFYHYSRFLLEKNQFQEIFATWSPVNLDMDRVPLDRIFSILTLTLALFMLGIGYMELRVRRGDCCKAMGTDSEMWVKLLVLVCLVTRFALFFEFKRMFQNWQQACLLEAPAGGGDRDGMMMPEALSLECMQQLHGSLKAYDMVHVFLGLTMLIVAYRTLAALSKYNRAFHLPILTIRNAFVETINFFLVFFILNVGFAAAACCMIGTRVFVFRNFFSTMCTLIEAVVAGVDMEMFGEDSLAYNMRILLSAYVLFQNFFILIILISIVDDAFDKAKKESQSSHRFDKAPLVPTVRRILRLLRLRRRRRKKRQEERQQSLRLNKMGDTGDGSCPAATAEEKIDTMAAAATAAVEMAEVCDDGEDDGEGAARRQRPRLELAKLTKTLEAVAALHDELREVRAGLLLEKKKKTEGGDAGAAGAGAGATESTATRASQSWSATKRTAPVPPPSERV